MIDLQSILQMIQSQQGPMGAQGGVPRPRTFAGFTNPSGQLQPMGPLSLQASQLGQGGAPPMRFLNPGPQFNRQPTQGQGTTPQMPTHNIDWQTILQGLQGGLF